MKFRFFFFTIVYLSGMSVMHGQTSSIVKKESFVYLRDPQKKIVDTLPSTIGFRHSKKKDTVIVYQYYKLVLPDNCPSYCFAETHYLIRQNRFHVVSSHNLYIENDGCGSFFYEDDLYCLYVYKTKITRSKLIIYTQDSEKKYTLQSRLPFSQKDQTISSLRNQLDKKISNPSCIKITLKEEDEQE